MFRRKLMAAADRNRTVVFEDPAAEAMCLALFDSDKDGRVSHADLQSVTTIPTIISAGLAGNVTKFNEFKYFTNLKSVTWNAFRNFVNLTEVEIPGSLTSTSAILGYIYKNKLTHLVIHDGVVGLSQYSFMGALSDDMTVHIPASVKTMGNSLFGWNTRQVFVFHGETPPKVDGYSYPVRGKVPGYAPDESVALYKANENIMKYMCSDILPISQLGGGK